MSKSESSDNVYKKLQRCRSELKKIPIKPTGNNKFAGYTYMELGDFLPHIVELCNEYGLCPVVCFESAIATLTIYNIHNPEDKVIFTSPMSTAALKGCHEVQNLGAVETYIKRYLFTHAFDIVEHDALDSTHGKQEGTKVIDGDSSKGKTPAAEPEKGGLTPPPLNKEGHPEPAIISEPQRKRLYAISKSNHWDDEGVKILLAEYGFASSKDITADKYNEICEKLTAKN